MQAVDSATIGPQALPVAAGGANEALTDPVVEAIADFLGWMLRHDLDAKLANLTGTSATAVTQSTHVFTIDPLHPRGHSVKRPLPSLYVWWDGQSSPWAVSVHRNGRKRIIQALYIFEEQPGFDAMYLRRGLLSAVDAIFHRAADQGGHPGYTYTAGGGEAGMLLQDSIVGYANTWGWRYLGGEQGAIKRVGIDDPEMAMRARRERRSHQDWPAFHGRFEVEELLQPDQSDLKLLGDSELTQATDGLTILERILEYGAGEEHDP